MGNEAVMSTNDDASSCKRYASEKGYWKDNFIQHFVKTVPDRKTPEINRGYYIRHKVVRHLVNEFLKVTSCDCQIVNIGAGFDTLYWNLHESDNLPKHGIYEIDMKYNVQKKCMLIKTKRQLNAFLSNYSINVRDAVITSDQYHLMSADVTNVPELEKCLMQAGIKKEVPTLFLAECVFVYLDPTHTENLLKFIANKFCNVMIVDYDAVNFNDRFGEVMKQNLRGRQCHLLGAQPDMQSKLKCYHKFSNVEAKLLFDVYNEVAKDEKQRMEKLEFLDEIDLLFDLLKHYCICWAYNDSTTIGFEKILI